MTAPRGHGRPCRVLHVITRLVHGGAQQNTILTAHRLRDRGFQPAIATGPTSGPEGTLEPLCRELGIPLAVIPELTREPSVLLDLRALYRLTRLIREGGFDIVHTHTSKAGFVGRLAARLAKAGAVIHTPHGHIFHDYYGLVRTSFYVMLERLAAPMADRILTLSRLEALDHRRLGIGLPGEFLHVPSGVDFSRFPAAAVSRSDARKRLGLAEGRPVVGSVGRLAPVKGHRHLVQAAALLKASLPDLAVVLVGDGELQGELEALAGDLGVSGSVLFAGLVPDVSSVLPAFDVAVFPSLNEGMGRAIAEAMFCGVPVVATRVGGVPELLASGAAGVLVPPRSPAALADAVRALLLDPRLRERLAARARSHVRETYSLEEMLSRIERVYRQVLSTR